MERTTSAVIALCVALLFNTIGYNGVGGGHHENSDYASDKSKVSIAQKKQVYGMDLLQELDKAISSAGTMSSKERVLEKFFLKHEKSIAYCYFASVSGKFISQPKVELPANYDPTGRPWYKEAIDNSTYKSELYVDAATGKTIQTLSSIIMSKGKVVGVAAIDFFVDDSDYSDVNVPTEVDDVVIESKVEVEKDKNKAIEESIKVELKQTMIDSLVMDLEKAKDTKTINKALETFKSGNEELVVYVYFASADGRMYLYPEQELPEGYDPRTRPWYLEADKTGGFISDPYIDALDNRVVQSIYRKINVGGKIVGIVGVDYYVDGVDR